MELALDEPHENDVVEQINGIRVSIDQRVLRFVENSSLDYQQSFFGAGLRLIGGSTSSC